MKRQLLQQLSQVQAVGLLFSTAMLKTQQADSVKRQAKNLTTRAGGFKLLQAQKDSGAGQMNYGAFGSRSQDHDHISQLDLSPVLRRTCQMLFPSFSDPLHV